MNEKRLRISLAASDYSTLEGWAERAFVRPRVLVVKIVEAWLRAGDRRLIERLLPKPCETATDEAKMRECIVRRWREIRHKDSTMWIEGQGGARRG